MHKTLTFIDGTFQNVKMEYCFLCNTEITDENAFYSLFDDHLDSSESIILNNLISILKRPIDINNSHSHYICKSCQDLCIEYEELSLQLDKLKNEIITNYNATIIKLNEAPILLEVTKTEIDDDDQIHVDTVDINDDNIEQTQDVTNYDEHMIIDPSATIENIESLNDTEKPLIRPKKVVIIQKINIQRIANDQNAITTIPQNKIIVEEALESDFVENENVNEYFDEGDSMSHQVEISTESDENIEHLIDEQSIVNESNVQYDNEAILEIGETVKSIKTDDDENDIETETTLNSKNGKIMKVKISKDVSLKPIFMRNGVDFECQLCPTPSEAVYDVRTIVLHLKNEHKEKVYICDVCGADFRKRTELNEHLEEHTLSATDGSFQCEICDRVFADLRLFRIHKRMHMAKVKSWTCTQCNKKYSSKNLLDEHMNMHTGDRPYKCPHCVKDFASKYTLTAHLKIHSDRKRPFECKTCTKSFFSIQNLTQHERTHSGIKEFICDICDKAFGTLHNLEVHKIVHTGYKPFICRTCGKAFARRAEIKDHERIHTGERPYHCDLCDANFAQRSNLMSHRRARHLNDKRYKCDQCEKCFKRKRLLDYHKKATHTGERPFKCEACGSTFVYPEHYKKHLRIHTGVKPYKCEVCGKAFNSRDNRNAHRFVHSDKKPYECVFCGQGFMRKPQLLAHMEQQNHKNEVIITNHAQVSVPMEFYDENDSKDKSTSSYLNDDEMLKNEIIEEQHIDEDELIIDGQVQFAEIDDDQDNDTEFIDTSNLCEEMPESVFVTEETELIEEDDVSDLKQTQLIQVQLPNSADNTAWISLVTD